MKIAPGTRNRRRNGSLLASLSVVCLGWSAVMAGVPGEASAQGFTGSSVYLSEEEYGRLQLDAVEEYRAAEYNAEHCNREGYERNLSHLRQALQYANASLLQNVTRVQQMSLRLKEIAEEFNRLVPGGNEWAGHDAAQYGVDWLVGQGANAVGQATQTVPLIGNAIAGVKALRGVADKIDKKGRARGILDRMERQYQEILDAVTSANRWKKLVDRLADLLERAGRLEVQPCPPEDKDEITTGGDTTRSPLGGAFVQVGTDSSTWCRYKEGTPTIVLIPLAGRPTTTTPGGGGAPPSGPGEPPAGGTPPAEGADGPRDLPLPGGPPNLGDPHDVGDPCDAIVALRLQYTRLWKLAQDPGNTDAERAETNEALEGLGERIRRLMEDCEESDPRDAAPPTGPPGEGPRDVPPPVTVTIYVKARASVLAPTGTSTQQAMAGQQIKLFPDSITNVSLPGPGVPKAQTDHDQDPIQGTTDAQGNLALDVQPDAVGLPSGAGVAAGVALAFEVNVDAADQASKNIQLPGGDAGAALRALPNELGAFVTDATSIGPSVFVTVTYPVTYAAIVDRLISTIPGVLSVETNFCRDKQGGPDDPYFVGQGAWGQPYDDQWALKRIGLTGGADSAWELLGEHPSPVVVAVIDTGLDWNHLDMDWENLWRNPGEIPDNGIDDDQNGYVDDVIGWNFYGRDNKPWDHDGHGTFVAGVIAATQNNGVGISGINPYARIMVLKALNSFGHSRASYLAKAIVYAADNGARLINMSVGGEKLTRIEKEAIDYALSKDVLIVAAAGNEGIHLGEFGPAGESGVLTVAATDLENRRTVFSNWGPQVDVAAPGIEILSLRARRTDTMRDIPEVEYVNRANYVGQDKRYYRASGTSFSAPMVTGVASLLLSKSPELSSDDVKRLLLHSARDIETPGVDQYSGYGLVDARAALRADVRFFIESAITGVQIAAGQQGRVLQVSGTSEADEFAGAWIEIGAGEEPESWTRVIDVTAPGRGIVLGEIDANLFRGSKVWILRLVTRHRNGKTREARFRLSLG